MRKHIQRIQTSFLLFFTLFALAACGGGGGTAPINNGGSGSDDDTDDPAAGITDISLRLSATATSTDEIRAISGSSPAVVVVSLSGSEEALENQIVNLSTTLGTLAQDSALTNANGEIAVTLTAGGSDPGAGTITATVDGNANLEATYNFAVVSEGTSTGTNSSDSLSLEAGLYDSDVDLDNLSSSSTITTISNVSTGFFVVTVTDIVTDTPVEGAIVSVTATAGEITPASGQVLTNSNGVAAVEIEAGSADPGAAGTLTAVIDDATASVNFAFGSADLQLGRDANGFGNPNDIDFVDGEIDIALGVGAELSSNGTTVLTVVAVATDETTVGFDSPLTINFSSTCSSAGDATIDTGVNTVNGIAEAIYEANGCEGLDTITARIAELSGVTATGSLVVESPTATSIGFVSASPEHISLKGTGDDQSTLIFEVRDGSGSPSANQEVTLELSTTAGGITLTGDSDGDGIITRTTNGSGQVSAVVNAGTIPTSVRVEASINVSGTTISTVSDSLVISTGLPDQNSFEIVASVLNPGGDANSGITSEITAFASDAFNNPVPDGTTVNFVTEYGTIVSTCSTTGGTCTATWTSSDPRAPDDPADTGVVQTIFNTSCDLDGDGTPDQSFSGVPCYNYLSYEDNADLDRDGDSDDYIVRNVKGGRSTILAYAIGEESFVDANGSGFYDWIDTDGDGIYDAGEPLEEFSDLPEAFIDHNDDGVFGNPLTGCDTYDGDGIGADTSDGTDQCGGARTGGQEEEFVDFIDNNTYDGDSDGDTNNGSVGNGIYNGTLCHPDVEAAGDCTTQLVHVRDEVRVLVAGNTAYLAAYSDAAAFGGEANTGGFSVAASGSGAAGDVDQNTDYLQIFVTDIYNSYLPNGTTIDIETDNCTLTSLDSYTIGNTNSDGVFSFFVGLRQDESGETDTGTVLITATVPEAAGGTTPSTMSFTCNDDPVL